MGTELGTKSGSQRCRTFAWNELRVQVAAKAFKWGFFFFLLLLLLFAKWEQSPTKKREGKERGREKERKWEGERRWKKKGWELREREGGGEREVVFFFPWMQAWGLKGDNHAAQQPAAKEVGRLQEQVCLAVEQHCLPGPGIIPDSCVPHRHMGLLINSDRAGDVRLETGVGCRTQP